MNSSVSKLKMETRLRASQEQFKVLIKFMESNGDIGKPRLGVQDKFKVFQLWQELKDLLNSKRGVSKSLDRWKKVWADWKAKTKRKALILRRQAASGDDVTIKQTLTASELRVLAVMGLSDLVDTPGEEDRGIDLPPSPPLLNPAKIEILDPEPSGEDPLNEPQSPISKESTATPSSQPRRKFRMFRIQRTPFENCATEFMAMERHRLQIEELRERQLHEREMERLRIESKRLDVEKGQMEIQQKQFQIFSRLSDNVDRLSEVVMQMRSSMPEETFIE